MTPTDALKVYAHHLQLAAPKEWEAFVQCFDAYATAVTVEVVNADQNTVLNQQGQARAFLHLLKTFRECHLRPQPAPPAAPSA